MSTILVADTSVLINFLKNDRMDLLGRYPGRILTTDHVALEIESDEQRIRYEASIAAGYVETCVVTDPEEIALYMRLGPGQRLGSGECSAIAVAIRRSYAIAIDDNRAVSRAIHEAGLVAARLEVKRTPDVIVELIRTGVLSIAEADSIKDLWAQHHRFRIKASSFRDLL